MSTWQSKRCKKRHARPQPTPEQLSAKRARADAKRMAEPVFYPPERQYGAWRGYLLCVIDGVATRVELHQGPAPVGRRPRGDRFEARVDEVAVAVGGLHVVARHMIGKMVPRSMPRRSF